MKERAHPQRLLLDVDAKSVLGGKARRPALALKRVLQNVAAVAHTLPLGVEWVRVERSSGGKGWHVIVATRERLEPVEQVAVQAVVGSDPVRERLNLMRARSKEARRYDGWQFLYGEKIPQ